jgi:hypothetical protein
MRRADASTSIQKLASMGKHNLVHWPLAYKMQAFGHFILLPAVALGLPVGLPV